MDENEREEARNEVTVISALRHPHIIEYIESFEDGGVLHIVMEYAAGGDLQTLIKQRSSGRIPVHFTEKVRLQFTFRLACARRFFCGSLSLLEHYSIFMIETYCTEILKCYWLLVFPYILGTKCIFIQRFENNKTWRLWNC